MIRKRRLLIDTDTASDDAVALITALRSPEIEVLGITVVAGNVAVEQATIRQSCAGLRCQCSAGPQSHSCADLR